MQRFLSNFVKQNGTATSKRYLHEHHERYLATLQKRHKEPERWKRWQKSVYEFVETHVSYASDSIAKIDHDRNLVLLLARGGLLISIVKHPDFKRYIYTSNARVRVPDEKTVRSILIPQVTKECNSEFVIIDLKDFEAVSITVDIRKSRGFENIFDLVAHELDQNFQPVQIYLTMLQCDNKNWVRLA